MGNFSNKVEELSYAFGINLATNLKEKGIAELSADSFAEAINVVYNGGEAKISNEDAMKVLNDTFQAMASKEYEGVIEEGQAFLAENAKNDDVVVLESGLQYKVITKGEGAIPTAEDTVTTHYAGKLLDGTKFDSSYDRNEPASFPVGQVIPGWVEALQLMPVGSKWELFIPFNLAYGEQGAGQAIPPFATLVFDIELISINEK